MRNSKRSGSFFPCLFINMLMNIEGLLPAVILLVLHFWLKISVWWSVGRCIYRVDLIFDHVDGIYRLGR